MIDLNASTITAAVLSRLANTPDARLRTVLEATVRHLHDLVREVSLTEAEWLALMRFLAATGQRCSPQHDEFILLSDVLGITSLVNLRQVSASTESVTSASALGPLYRTGAPLLELGASLARLKPGPELLVHGRVLDAEHRPVPSALIDVWLTDTDGLYDLQAHGPTEMDLRGRFRADAEGRYWFRTTRPRCYPIPMDGPVGDLERATAQHGMRPAHVHFWVQAPGCRDLVTALFLNQDPYLQSDAAFGVRRDLVVDIQPPQNDRALPALPRIHFDFTLARARAAGDGAAPGTAH